MNEWLIARWNEKVKPDDEIWFLGDFAFCGTTKSTEILTRLKGRKNLILGNHDYGKKIDPFFETVQHYKSLRVNGQQIVLCHFPILSWDGMAHGSWHLHGHCHGSLVGGPFDVGLRLDVGVDCHDWYPVSYEDIRAIMNTRAFVKVDHHE
jgi:calcineurin-like phosphoesterase family protein